MFSVVGRSLRRTNINYIHENPVKAGFVSNAEDYEYSSARWFAGKDCVLEVSNL